MDQFRLRGGAEDDRRTMASFCASLSGAALEGDVCAGLPPRDWRRLPEGRLLIEERTVRDGWDWIDNSWVVLDGDRRRDVRLGHRLCTAVELGEPVRSAGFVGLRTYDRLSGSPFDDHATRPGLVG